MQEKYQQLVAKLRATVSESKRKMLDDAADAIEYLSGEREFWRDKYLEEIARNNYERK